MDKADRIKKQKDDHKELIEQINQGVLNVFQSENYKNYLKFCAKFNQYSFNNKVLIYDQKPDATLVAGFSKWKTYGRHIKSGEKGIKIVSPYKFNIPIIKDPAAVPASTSPSHITESEVETKTFIKFKKAYVFDVSQTDGKELPSVGVKELTAAVDHYSDIKEALEKISPVPIHFEDIKNGAKGFYAYDKEDPEKPGFIVVQKGMPEAQTLKTMIHEISHSIIDNPKSDIPSADKSTREVRAEAIAFIVCDHFGLDTSDYTFPYLATWTKGREVPELKENLKIITDTSSKIYEDMQEIMKDRELIIDNLDSVIESAEAEADGSDQKETKKQDLEIAC